MATYLPGPGSAAFAPIVRFTFSSLVALIFCGLSACGGGGGASEGDTQQTSPVGISVSPASAAVIAGSTAQFTASVTNTSNTGVTWSVNGSQGGNSGAGTISAAGLYTAPETVPNPSTVTVSATSVADPTKIANSAVSVSPPPPRVSISVSPTSDHVVAGSTAQFTATVTNASNSLVTWSVNGSQGGNGTVGVISSNGLYTAPAVVPNPSTVTVSAVYSADATIVATAAVTVFIPPPTVTVAVLPASANTSAGIGTIQFSATVGNSSNQAVLWAVNGIIGGTASVGAISTNGLYSAPTSIPSPSVVTVTATSAASASGVGTASVTITPRPAITLTPALACVDAGGQIAVSAAVAYDTGNAGVSWSLAGSNCGGSACGSLSAVTTRSVVYSAPSVVTASQTVIITAHSNADPTRSSFTLATLPGISVTLTPRRAALTTSQPQVFSATVANACASSGVTWTVDGVAAGNATVGTINSSGTYTPPNVAGTHVISAVSVADPTKSSSANVAVTDLAAIATYHYDNARTGQNNKEYALTPTTVNAGSFGKLFACSVDGDLYAEPLYVANLPIAGGTHNVVFVATEHDSVYAFDADLPSCHAYWHVSFLGAGISTMPATLTGEAGNMSEVGITGTPVIDMGRSVLYVVAATLQSDGTNSQKLHALDLSSGAEKAGSPATITGSSAVTFNPVKQNQRSALLLAGNTVYISWGSHDDFVPYHGIVMGYDATSLALVSTFNATPDGTQGAIWMGGSGPAEDGAGTLYLATGNGTFDDVSGALPLLAPNDDLGDSVVRLAAGSGLSVTGFFTPSDQLMLANSDLDLGSGGIMLLPDQVGSSAHPHLLLLGDKRGRLYLLDRDSLGGFTVNGPDRSVQAITVTPPPSSSWGIFSTPAVWNGVVFVGAGNDALRAFPISGAALATSPTSLSIENQGLMGATPVVTSQGASMGIVWLLDNDANGTFNGSATGPAILRAYDATNLESLLYSSEANAADTCGNAVKFAVPTVANGKVYAGGSGQMTVYGLLP